MFNLNKETWDADSIKEFSYYLSSLRNAEKVEWTAKITNTKKPLLAIKTPTLKKIAKDIKKGNYISFLEQNTNNFHETDMIKAFLICGIEDFDLQKKYLDEFVLTIDDWASCDCLVFDVRGKEEKYFSLAKTYLENEKTFVRRVGFRILFSFVEKENYVDKIFDILNSFGSEKEYYLNMIIAWLTAELFIKQREKTLEFLKTHKLNKFQINKTISKCRDSFRVSSEDKEKLLSYKVK